ncbi:MAG: SDR family oxidoreductase [Planctomycetes bacterium]|nr:SDR family oxidoreductase [Planctomycetota bacterium]
MTGTPSGPRRVFVTGASGYIGGRLVPQLLARGHTVVCAARDPRKLQCRAWASAPGVSIATIDLATGSPEAAMSGCGAAYYLVHSMTSAGDAFRHRDLELAATFAAAARRAGVGRIIYLGGLGEMGDGLSEHLASRREVEHTLAAAGVPLTVLRAAMIIGSGSASFEILRYLVERLPVMVTPRWVTTECQPIAVANVIEHLVRCLDVDATIGATLDIGGPDILDYRSLMRVMQEELGVARRLVIPLPILTPRLSSLWIHLVTPISHAIARPLAEGLRNRVICRDDRAVRLMPFELLTARAAIRRALEHQSSSAVETSWSDAGPIPGDPDWAGGRVFVDRRECTIRADRAQVFAAVCRIGGGHGYYAADLLWRARGWIDRLVGGPGLRRRRRHPDVVRFGEALDFWRVTGLEPGQRLELRAEMKLPGQATLEFTLADGGADGGTRLIQTARFRPRGLAGLLYWWAIVPLHAFVFRGMLDGIRRHAERAVIRVVAG